VEECEQNGMCKRERDKRGNECSILLVTENVVPQPQRNCRHCGNLARAEIPDMNSLIQCKGEDGTYDVGGDSTACELRAGASADWAAEVLVSNENYQSVNQTNSSSWLKSLQPLHLQVPSCAVPAC
jgi:hypothetical protein